MNWEKSWVWIGKEERPRNFYAFFRGWFEVRKGVKKVLVHLTADSRYLLYLNDRYLGRGPAKSDPQFQDFDTYDVTKKVAVGRNLLAVVVHHYGEETFSYLLGRGGFICQVEVFYRAGRREVFGTDNSWRVKEATSWDRNAPRLSVQLGFQEIYDTRREIPDWQKSSFNDAGWSKPVILGKPPVAPWEKLTPRDIPFLKERFIRPQKIVQIGEIAERSELDNQKVAETLTEELHLPWSEDRIRNLNGILRTGNRFAEMEVPPNGLYLIFDFGREVTGFPCFEIETQEEGGILDAGYDEFLPGNRPNLIREPGGKVKYADRYFLRSGRISHQNSFTWRGFRYLILVLRHLRKPVRIYSPGLIEYLYPVRNQGLFESDDPLLNRIWEVSRYTLRLCMHDSYEDCPWREQTQWWGDGRVEALANYYLFGDRRLVKRGLRQIAETQDRRKDSLMQPFAPGGLYGSPIHPGMRVIPTFCLLWILSLKEYYLYTGDIGPVRDLYFNLTKMLDGFQRFLTERKLLSFGSDYWNFVDWAKLDCESETTALNCLYVGALQAAAEIASLNNDSNRKTEYLQYAEAVKSAVNQYLWDRKKGLYADSIHGDNLSEVYSQQSNSLAVLFGVAEKSVRLMEAALFDQKLIQVASPYFMSYFLAALFKVGRHEVALEIIRRRWGKMIGQGTTTFWEVFPKDPQSKSNSSALSPEEGSSLCHGWSSMPAFFLVSEYLSVKPLSPGFKKVLIQPRVIGVKKMSGTVPTPFGKITVAWRSEPKFTIEVSLPDKITAVLVVPEQKPKEIRGKFSC